MVLLALSAALSRFLKEGMLEDAIREGWGVVSQLIGSGPILIYFSSVSSGGSEARKFSELCVCVCVFWHFSREEATNLDQNPV